MTRSVAIGVLVGSLVGCGRTVSNRDGRGPSDAAPQIVFGTLTHGAIGGPDQVYEVAVMNLDGSGRRQLTSDGKFKFLPHLSPDGMKVVYTKFLVGQYGSPDAVTDVALYDLATDAETMLTSSGDAVQPTWSPDGKRIAYLGGAGIGGGAVQASKIWTVDLGGVNPQLVAAPSGASDDEFWADIAWSSQDWILFVVAQNVAGCFKARIDKIRPDGSSRTQVTDGGPNCTPQGSSQSGDADPGWSADGKTIYSSRGLQAMPPGTEVSRHLYAFSSDAWVLGKQETDLQASEPSCGCNTPKGSPDGTRVILDRGCPDDKPKGIYVTDTLGSYWTYVGEGIGPDWNSAVSP